MNSASTSKRGAFSPLFLLPGIAVGGVLLVAILIGARPEPMQKIIAEREAADARWNGMINAIEANAAGYGGSVGIYLKDLRSGRVYERNADRRFVSASLIKLPIMAAVFEAINEGRFSLDSEWRYGRRDRRGGSGVLKWARLGTVFPVSYLLQQMMAHSDNSATAMVIERLGYDYLNDCFARFGLVETRIQPRGMSLSNRIRPEQDNYTTPREMGDLLEKIYRRQMVSPLFSSMMIDYMKGASKRSRLGRPLPREWELAHKTGLLRKYCHDVGIVFTPGRDYILCVLTGRNPNYRVAKGFIESVGRAAYVYMGDS